MEIRDKKIDSINLSANINVKKYETKKIEEEKLADADCVNIRNLEPEIEVDNTQKVSELKHKYATGTLNYNSKDVAKAFLKEAVGIY